MYKKSITDPLEGVTSSLLSFQKQLENVCRLPEVVPNSSVTKFLNQQNN